MFRLLKLLARLVPLRLFGLGGRTPRLRWALLLLAAVAGIHAHIMPEWLGSLITRVTGINIAAASSQSTPPSTSAGLLGSWGTGDAKTSRGSYNPPAEFQGGTGAALSPRLFASFADSALRQEQLQRLPDSPPPLAAKPSDAPWRLLSQVVDGDTVIVDNRTVRLIGVDSPEANESARLGNELRRIGAEREAGAMLALGAAAAAFTSRVAEGKRCWLEYDGATTDQSGHILAYVHLEDGTNLNEALIYNGYAKTNTAAGFRYLKRYMYLQNEAQRLGHGLWTRTQ